MGNPRIIAGSRRGLRLKPVPGKSTRPITDKVKEALFNIIGGEVVDCFFLDLFGGTGSVGIEALSRGARHAVFVEKNFAAFKTLKTNIDLANFDEQAEILHMDAFKYLQGSPDEQFDIIYVAPPQYKGMWKKAISLLDENPGWLFAGGEIILQIDFLEYEETGLTHFRETRQKRYGDTLLVFYLANQEISPNSQT